MINPNNPTHVRRLKMADDYGYRQLRPFRASRLQLIKDYIGNSLGSDGADPEERRTFTQLANFMLQAAEIHMVSLGFNCPRFKITSQHPSLNGFARRFQTGLNNLVKEIQFEDTMQEIILDAFFRIGIGKICFADSVPVQVGDDINIDPGRPFFGRVSIDDWCHDMTATSWSRVKFMRDEYEVPFEALQDGNIFNQANARKVKPDQNRDRNEDGDEPARSLGRDSDDRGGELEPVVRLRDYFLPREGLIVTFERTMEAGPLAIRDADGPEGGPYPILQFVKTPDQTMSSSAADNIKPLCDLTNSLLRKLSRQARRQRDIPIYEPSASDDADRVKKADDGQWTKVARKDGVGVMKMGGVDSGNQAFMMTMTDLLDRMGGNLRAAGGLGVESGTYGQEKLMHSQISRTEARSLYLVNQFASRAGSQLGWIMWIDRVNTVPGFETVDGFPDVRVQADWTPDLREGDFLQYNFAVEPYSMGFRSPADRLAAVDNFLATTVPGIMQAGAMQQGYTIEAGEIFEFYADMLDEPRIRSFFRFGGEPLDPGVAPSQAPSSKQSEPNVRYNIPTGGTSKSRTATMVNALLGGAVNDDQAAALARPAV